MPKVGHTWPDRELARLWRKLFTRGIHDEGTNNAVSALHVDVGTYNIAGWWTISIAISSI